MTPQKTRETTKRLAAQTPVDQREMTKKQRATPKNHPHPLLKAMTMKKRTKIIVKFDNQIISNLVPSRKFTS